MAFLCPLKILQKNYQVDDLYGIFTFKIGQPEIIDSPLTWALSKGNIFKGDEFNLVEDSILQTLSIAFENNKRDNKNPFYVIAGIWTKIKYKKSFFLLFVKTIHHQQVAKNYLILLKKV